jgi:hypothetical protein
MSTKNRIKIFSILAGLVLAAVTSGIIIAVGSVSAQNNSTEQQSSEAGSNGTAIATGGNTTSSTAAGTKVSIIEEASEMGD